MVAGKAEEVGPQRRAIVREDGGWSEDSGGLSLAASRLQCVGRVPGSQAGGWIAVVGEALHWLW
jgi:hypothetical protein